MGRVYRFKGGELDGQKLDTAGTRFFVHPRRAGGDEYYKKTRNSEGDPATMAPPVYEYVLDHIRPDFDGRARPLVGHVDDVLHFASPVTDDDDYG